MARVTDVIRNFKFKTLPSVGTTSGLHFLRTELMRKEATGAVPTGLVVTATLFEAAVGLPNEKIIVCTKISVNSQDFYRIYAVSLYNLQDLGRLPFFNLQDI